MRSLIIHILFIAATVGAGMFVGTTWPPGAWYEGLQKPFFTPPDAWFPIVWGTLYAIIGLVGARLLLRGGPGLLWVAQMALNLSWTPVFFGAHHMVAGFGIIAALWLTVIAFILRAWPRDPLSSLLFVPYALWVTVAAALNGALILLN
ncbi:TspO/MBR family protein [Falsirhodobacter halotolerans]|uniref:TspO/MBR family protein n=1 Tax=Falsirhodobacter halotolerans TaxID=1146892 RepID=UPI001FD31B23|nr:TspO/MBR family protein [Falsirhodobacter halotolerans]MCJ8140593.1 tryptophan-rich sensory protein [Falsirhodobacter halotolerans]